MKSREAIRALACGYSSRAKAKKLMVALRGFVDDSSSDTGDQRLFLAAYIHTVEIWESLADAWDDELARDGLDYFKMSEAKALQGEFRGWLPEARNAKVLAFAKIIEAHRPWFIYCSVSKKDYAEILAPGAPYGLKNPYFLCFWGVIKTTARYHQYLGPNAPPVDFVFDDQGGVGDDAALWYRWLKDDEDQETRGILGSTPIFRDDKDMVPLQAADMLAWHVRRDHEDGGLTDKTVFELLISEEGAGVHFPREKLVEIAPSMAKIPGLSKTQSKSDWRKMRKTVSALIAAGAPAPNTSMSWMRYVAFRAWLERVWKSWRRLRQWLLRRIG